MLSKELLEMPKLDLHCHLDGSLTLASVRELLGREVKPEELQVEEDCKSLAQYLEKFDLPIQCLQSEKGLRTASREFLLDLQKDNIRYVEVRFAPLFSVHESLNIRQVMEAVLTGLEEGKKESGIDYNVIACAMRHHSQEKNLAMVKSCREFLGEGLCAVDLAGDEAAFPMEEYRELFAQVKKMGIPFTIHAGECGRVENVKLSVECGARRIGHGIALRGHRDVMELCKNRNIGIEMCPVSNMQTKAVARRSEYPIREFLDAGLLVTLNTDNRTVSNTTIVKEMEFVQEHFGVTDEELKMITKHAVDVAFAADEVKAGLWRALEGV